MELDLAGMHQLAAGQGIDPETLDAALSEALRLAYLKTPHAAKHARVELDPRAGSFTVWAQDEIPVEPTEDNPHPAPTLGEEYDDTPRDFGRLAAATARQVISQLFRKAEDDKVFGAFSGQKGKLITGIVQQDVKDTSNVHVAVGDVEALLPRREQVPGERYRHGERIRVYVVNVARGLKGPEIVVSRSHPELVRRLFEREVGVELLVGKQQPASDRDTCLVTVTGGEQRARGGLLASCLLRICPTAQITARAVSLARGAATSAFCPPAITWALVTI